VRRITRTVAVKELESFFSEGVENVVFRREISVDGCGAVLDALGDLANRDMLIAVSNEQIAGRVQNGAANRFSLASLSLFDAHVGARCRCRVQAGPAGELTV